MIDSYDKNRQDCLFSIPPSIAVINDYVSAKVNT